MKKISIEAKKDFLESLAQASPIKAVSELIWNGLDAGAEYVTVLLGRNQLDGLETIQVQDSGSGINHTDIQTLFGNLGESWKKNKGRFKGRALHGKKGQGRFKAFSLGTRVEWNTVYEVNNRRMRFKIIGVADALTDLQFSDPVFANGHPCGTEVLISGVEQKKYGALLKDSAKEELAKLFAVYLSQYPDVRIEYDGVPVDPVKMQRDKKDILLDNIVLANGKIISASVTIVEWLMPVTRVIYLCDADGVSLQEIEAGSQLRAPGFEFSVYVKSNHFRELGREGALDLQELHPDVDLILQSTKKAVKTYFREKLVGQNSHIVERWKKAHIYPFEEKEHLNSIERAERQVFDILAVNVESYLPAFVEADVQSKKFMFRLLAQALQDNPNSVQRIITELLNLKKEEQEALAELLEATSLSNIISSAKTVANRLDFLVALENLIFDKETKSKLLERDQLHKILEQEAWIFDEEFALSGSEKTLEEVLALHLGELRTEMASDPVLREGGKRGRVDLMFSRMVQPRHDERDHLVVELKRPSQLINSKIISQVESYALAVAQDPRFLKDKTRWRFMVVSNSMDDHAKRKATQKDKRRGLVFDDGELNIQVWAFEWTDIIANARARLQFINESLSYEANRETSKSYLLKAHEKFIPATESLEQEQAVSIVQATGTEEV
ncbi:MAG: ATP-binding protein [Chlorobiales bacterium]|nr:ATP-binding protein [Chlorobiales bacterium]